MHEPDVLIVPPPNKRRLNKRVLKRLFFPRDNFLYAADTLASFTSLFTLQTPSHCNSLAYSFIYMLTHLNTNLLTYSFIYMLTYLLLLAFSNLFIYPHPG